MPLCAEGWEQKQIAQALRIRYETVQDHLGDFNNSKKLKPENGGSHNSYEKIDSKAMKKHFTALRKKHPKARRIHQILYNGPYNISHETKQAAEKYKIVLHYLSPYSPNLNPIERLWKVMSGFTRNNRVFKTATEFKKTINDFFCITWPEISHSMVERINDNFQTFNKVPSS